MTEPRQGIVQQPGEGAVLAGSTGARFLVKAGAEDTRGAWTLIEGIVPPGIGGPLPHIHYEHEEAFYVLEGAVTLQLGERRIDAQPGAFVLVPRGTVHTYANGGEGTARFLTIGSPSGMEAMFAAFAELRKSAPGGQIDFPALQATGRRYDSEYLAPPGQP